MIDSESNSCEVVVGEVAIDNPPTRDEFGSLIAIDASLQDSYFLSKLKSLSSALFFSLNLEELECFTKWNLEGVKKYLLSLMPMLDGKYELKNNRLFEGSRVLVGFRLLLGFEFNDSKGIFSRSIESQEV